VPIEGRKRLGQGERKKDVQKRGLVQKDVIILGKKKKKAQRELQSVVRGRPARA